jgi:hypothetical protein
MGVSFHPVGRRFEGRESATTDRTLRLRQAG